MKKLFTKLFYIILLSSSISLGWSSELPRIYQPQTFSYASSVIPNADNGFTILGYYKNIPTDLYRPRVTKFDQKGEVQWEQVFNSFPLQDFTGVDEGLIFKSGLNDGYFLISTMPSTNLNGRFWGIGKFDNNFNPLYNFEPSATQNIGFDETFLNGWNLTVNKIKPTPEGGFVVVGTNLTDCYNKSFVMARYNDTGALSWSESTPVTNSCVQFRYDAPVVEKLSDGGFLFGIANRTQVSFNVFNGIFNLVKKDANGTTVWVRDITTSYDVSQVANKNVLLAEKELTNGNIKIVTLYDINGSDYRGGTFLQYTLSPLGSIIQTDTFNFYLPLTTGENLRKIDIDKDENIIILGQKSITKLDKKGKLIWQHIPFDELRFFDSPGLKHTLTSYTQNTDGNYIIVGNSFQTTNNNNSTISIFTITADGKMKSKILYGSVFVDLDNTCSYTNGELGYQGLVVKAEKNNQSFYTITDSIGGYSIPLDTGLYNIFVQLPNSSFWRTCSSPYLADLTGYNPTLNLNIPIQPKVNCPFLNVELNIPFLRKCYPKNYTVSYCNSGTTTASNAYILIDFDADLQINSASLPWASFVGNQYRFNIGNIPPQTCGTFTVNATVSCSAIDGKTHCSTAHIYPDDACAITSPLWDGSNISVTGSCDGDTANIIIKNTGINGMVAPRKYIVIEGDLMRVAPKDFQLAANQSIVLRLYAGGKTIRVQAQQDPNFPYPSTPSITIESCTGSIDSLDLVNQFPQNDGAAFLATSCVQNRNSYDPNEKTAQPVGYLSNHIIDNNTEIKYTIHFQNTGSDTAYRVEVLDTISSVLDLTTLTITASSHPYSYTVFGGNILQFNFPNINLPDSTINQAASNGFISFHLKPKPSTSKGTPIYNTAQIYFDYNAAMPTNRVLHTVDSLLLRLTAIKTNTTYLSDLKIYPNPFSNSATIELKLEKTNKTVDLQVFDISGKQITQQKITKGSVILNGNDFQSGMYILQFSIENEIIGTAKLLKQ